MVAFARGQDKPAVIGDRILDGLWTPGVVGNFDPVPSFHVEQCVKTPPSQSDSILRNGRGSSQTVSTHFGLSLRGLFTNSPTGEAPLLRRADQEVRRRCQSALQSNR